MGDRSDAALTAACLADAGFDASVDFGGGAVTVEHAAHCYVLAMPSPGTNYALFVDGAYRGTMGRCIDDSPHVVASVMATLFDAEAEVA